MRRVINLSIVVALVLGTVIGAAAYYHYARADQSQWHISTTSPDGNYRVELIGKTEAASRPYYRHGEHHVAFSVFKDGSAFLKNVPLYGGDQYDDLFLDLYPVQEWVSASTVRFGEKTTLPDSERDQILVSNNTDKSFDYVRIDFGVSDIFLNLKLSPGEKIQLFAEPQTNQQRDTSGITCYVGTNGNYIEKSAGFDIQGKNISPAHYYIDIEDSGINIKSREFQAVK